MKLNVATGQFPVGSSVGQNKGYICRQVAAVARLGAHVILFPETALSGYAGIDFQSFSGYDWGALRAATEEVMAAAKRHGIWVILGSTHRLSGRSKPHISLYIIDPRGRVVNRYDKRFCARNELARCQPGAEAVTVKIEGVRCGFLICHEWRYPELYRLYKKRSVEVIFQAWYDGNLTSRQMEVEGAGLGEVIPATVRGHAVCNHLWICGTNTSARESCFGAFVVRPDGMFLRRQPRHRSGVMVCAIDTDEQIDDLAAHARDRAMGGVEKLGPPLADPRSTDRRCI